MTPITAQPSLRDLTARFLASKAAAPFEAVEDSEVQPHEVIGGFQTPVRATWDEALAAFRLFGVTAEKLACPPEWAAFVALETNLVSIPLAAGLFPQRFHKLPGQVTAADTNPRPTQQVAGFSGLRGWVRKALRSASTTQLIVAAGVAAQLGDWADAEAALTEAEALCDGPWKAVLANQRAAVAWLQGNTAQATQIWSQGTTPVNAFNRGLSQTGEVRRSEFTAASAALPETSGWRHLAALYQLLPV